MRGHAISEEDRAATVIPTVVSGMPWRVTAVAALPDFRLRVRFLDGTEGEVDLAPLIGSAQAGVFAALADPVRFAEAFVELGAVAWPCGLDLAPDTMYRAIKSGGVHTVGAAG